MGATPGRSEGSGTATAPCGQSCSGQCGCGGCCGSVHFGAQDLGPQDRLVEAELAVELVDRVRLRDHVDDGVNAVRLLLDLVREPPPAPYVDLVHRATPGLHDRQELVERGLDGLLFERGIEDDHHLIAAHAGTCLLWTDAATVSPWQEGPRRHRCEIPGTRCGCVSLPGRTDRLAQDSGAPGTGKTNRTR